ncbi:MAG: hypothetical protein JWN52_3579 [Actinomycetia bacterium]|nr:hypothetical protein [Actinomycetes bacterium]
MANGVFNIVKGKIAYYAGLPAANDALIVVLLKSTGLVSDATMVDYDDLATILAGASDECDFASYVRKTVTASITVTVDDTNDRVDIDMPDLTWSAATTGQAIGKLLVCYDPDTTTGTDSSVIPLTFHDFVASTDGNDLVATIATAGFARAA